ncbi:high affinity cGMP-specific 3',5'-cyclic phosphodiesterase 9A [Exaiptasia diaphana]|uniref:Phosphodiesterase n=1 Tax=Exaiptasia diaphana TaxID=2652724 RepID=A0A913YAT3_EXADI|nr:high affinity cGMP-specific 3',5'-cyclic phosphodiesterase 9A [Exaiptasia diaphana]
MTSKVIYFKVGDRDEQAEISSDIPTEDVKDLFRCAAEAGPNDILKLYNIKGNIVNISGKLQENSPETRYRLEAVATNCPACGVCDNEHTLLALEERLEKLEEKILIENGETPSVVKDIKSKVDSFRDKLESLEHLSWLGLFKEMSSGTRRSGAGKPVLTRKTSEEFEKVFSRFKKLANSELSEETRNILKKPTFDNWQWDEEEMLYLLQQMYIDLGLLNAFRIERATLQQFLYEVYRHYNPTPFHNFRHAFCVTQMMYGLIWMTEITSKIEPHEVLIMLTSALCHDLDHPGYNNAYQINARTELALRYNDISPLENHHCAVAFDIMSQKKSNILKNVPPDMFKKVREGMIKCILATDMGRHSDILNKFKEQLKSSFDFTNEEHKSMLMQIMIKVSDVSNEARPMDVAEPWLDCLLQEFFIQSDVEKMEGLPVAPFMDRDKVTKPSAQIGFIKFVLIPLFEALGRLFPILEDQLISPVRKALNYYVDMGHTMEKELKKKNSREESEKTSEQLQKENAVPKEKLTNGTAD